MMCRPEPRLAKITWYQTKYVEKSGKQLSKYFSKEKARNTCDRDECGVCLNADGKKPTLCQVKDVVYLGVCQVCDVEHREEI